MKKQIATIALACIAIGGGAYGVTRILTESTGKSIVHTSEPIVTALPDEEVISIPTTTEAPDETETKKEATGITDTASIYEEYTNEAMGYYVSVSSYKTEVISNGVSFECSAVLKNTAASDKKLSISSIRVIDEATKLQYACTSSYFGTSTLPNKNDITLGAGKSDVLSFKGAVGITSTEAPRCAIYLTIKDSVTGDTLNLYLKLHSSIYDSEVKKLSLTDEAMSLEDYGITVTHLESKTTKLGTHLQIAELFEVTNLSDSPLEIGGYMASLTAGGKTTSLKATTTSDLQFPNSAEGMEYEVLNAINTGSAPNDENCADFTFSSMVTDGATQTDINPSITFSVYLPDYSVILEFTYNVVL